MKERKETLSPTFLQTIASYKSPLTAFGEGLMKVGETNQKIHDTIWEHDLRQERLERERALHDMQVEAHELKMRRENFEQEQNEKYSSAEREAGIAKTRADTWNTSENALWTQTRKNAFVDDRTRQHFVQAAITNGLISPEGDIVEKGQEFIEQLDNIINDTTKSMEERTRARNQRLMIDEEAGKLYMQHLNSGESREIAIRNAWLKEHFGLEYEVTDKGRLIQGSGNKFANSIVTSLYNTAIQYPETFRKIMKGEISIDDIQDDTEKYKFRNAFGNFTSKYPLPKYLEQKRNALIDVIPMLRAAANGYEKIKDKNQLITAISNKMASVFGSDFTLPFAGDNATYQVIESNAKMMLMIVGKAQMAGALSNQDMQLIRDTIGEAWKNNQELYIKMKAQLENMVQSINTSLNNQPEVIRKAYFDGVLKSAQYVIDTIKLHEEGKEWYDPKSNNSPQIVPAKIGNAQ